MDEIIKPLLTGETEEAGPALKLFLEKYTATFTFPELNNSNNRQDLWIALSGYIKNDKCSDLHADCLSVMRILSREKINLNEVMNEDLLSTIVQLAGINRVIDYTHESTFLIAFQAMKVLSNLIFNSNVAAAMCCKNGTVEGITGRLHIFRDPKVPSDITLIDVKILFLITALCSEMRVKLREHLPKITSLIEVILKESTDSDNKENEPENKRKLVKLSGENADLACEILKLLFNLTLTYDTTDEDVEEQYASLVEMLRELLNAKVEQEDKRTELTNHIINLFTNMPNSCLSRLYRPVTKDSEIDEEAVFMDYDMSAVREMLNFLRGRLSEETTVSKQNEILTPVLNTLLKIAVSERPIRKYLKNQILPPLKDVHNRPEQGDTLRNCMCRLLTTPITQVRDLNAELLFVLCKEDVKKMIKYTGYGNAAGLFATKGLLCGDKRTDVSVYSSESEDSDTEEYKQYKHGINPILGCYEPPHPNPMANMTQEEKEYEAMQLVKLMDSLTRLGTVKPCKVGKDGKPVPVEHILELQDGLPDMQHLDSDSE